MTTIIYSSWPLSQNVSCKVFVIIRLGCFKDRVPDGAWTIGLALGRRMSNDSLQQTQVLIGDSGAGKSCLLLRFADDAFTDSNLEAENRCLALTIFTSFFGFAPRLYHHHWS